MLKRLTVAMGMLLVVAVCAAVFATVWSRTHKGEVVKAPVFPSAAQEEFSDEESSNSADLTEQSSQTADEGESETDLPTSQQYNPAAGFKVKLKTRTFSHQNDRIKHYKNYFAKTFKDESKADVFLYDITHDGLVDMIILTPVYNDTGKKIVGTIVQLFTITNDTTVTEIFRDYGGYSHSGGNFCCYVTEKNGQDCLLIAKDDLWQGKGSLSLSVFYVLNDATVVTLVSSGYSSKDSEAYDTEAAFNSYSSSLETQIAAAHTTLVDYRSPYAVTSKASDVFGKYIK